jgi:hypothetical protein
METITTNKAFLLIIGVLLLIGLIRFLAQWTQRDYLDEHYDSEYDPEKELGIGAFQKPIEHKNQNLIVLKHLENGLCADEKFAKQHNIKNLSAVIATLNKRGHMIGYVKEGSVKGYVLISKTKTNKGDVLKK